MERVEVSNVALAVCVCVFYIVPAYVTRLVSILTLVSLVGYFIGGSAN